MGPLRNPRHEKFVTGLFEGLPASRAFVEAGYAPNDGNAIRLKGNEKVQARLAELQAAAQRDSEVTVKSLLAELEQARLQASDLKQYSAVVRSIESKARISGLLTEKVEVKTTTDEDYTDWTNDDLLDLWTRQYRERGYSEKDIESFRAFTRPWLESMETFISCPHGTVVSPPRMSDQQRENIERKRLGLPQRPLINGGVKSVP
jgi:hypothetical protein